MLEKRFTVRQILQFIIVIVVGMVLIVANVDEHKKRKANYSNDERIDSISRKVSALEIELDKIIQDNRLCNIIGAYTILNQNTVDPTVENVEALVIICECWYPDIIMAQYHLESSKGTSYVAKKNKNLFGMKKAWTRKSVRCRAFDNQGYAIYNNWQLSVVDRIFWEEHEFNGVKPSKEQYLARIKKIYAKDEHYIEKIKKIAKDYEYLYDYIEERD